MKKIFCEFLEMNFVGILQRNYNIKYILNILL